MRRCTWRQDGVDHEGFFHCFMQETNYNSGHQYAAAIVEKDNGKVWVVEAAVLLFTEPYDPNEELNKWRHKKRS